MNKVDYIEFTKNLIKEAQAAMTEEEVENLAKSLVNQASEEVERREKIRHEIAIQRGIDLTNNVVVSKKVYEWYTNLTEEEYVKEYGFKRQDGKLLPGSYSTGSIAPTDAQAGIENGNFNKEAECQAIKQGRQVTKEGIYSNDKEQGTTHSASTRRNRDQINRCHIKMENNNSMSQRQ